MNNFFSFIKKFDFIILIIVILLSAISVTMIESTVYNDGIVLSRIVLVQGFSLLFGLFLIFVMQFFDYRKLKDMRKILYIMAILLLLSVYIPGLGDRRYNSLAWINLGFTTLQPSELVKILFAFVMADYLCDKKGELESFIGVAKALLYAAPIILITLKEDLGSALVFIFGWIFMVFFAGISYKLFIQYALVSAACVPFIYMFLDPYQKQRIGAFLHPDNLSLPGNSQVWQSKIAIGSGGFLGKGLFNGTQKSLDFLPVQQSDFIFSVIVEELGFLGGAFVVFLYLVLFIRISLIIRNSMDLYGALVVTGLLSMLLFQVFENIAMTMGLMPVTGITLPLLSAGGTSAIATMITFGVILNVGLRSKSSFS